MREVEGGAVAVGSAIRVILAAQSQENFSIMELSPGKLTLIVVASIILGIAIAIVGGFVWMYSMFTTGGSVSFGGGSKAKAVTSAPYEDPPPAFLDTTNMTWGNTPSRDLAELVPGDPRIIGSAKVNGKSLQGLRVRLVLNRKANSPWGMTDANGRYEIPVPPGKYQVSGFEFDREAADKLLPGKIIHPGCLGIRCREDPPSEVSAGKPGKGIDFEFIDPVVLLAPMGDITIGDALIARWKPYPGAARYRIALYEIPPRFGSGSSHSIFDWKERPEVADNSIDLIKAGLTPKDGQDYSIRIDALDEKGVVLSQNPSVLWHSNFRLVKKP